MKAIGYRSNTPEVIDIPNTMEALQTFVGGYVESHSLPGGVVLLCDEDGKPKGLKPVYPFVCCGELIAGNFLIVRYNPDSGDFIDVTDQDIERYSKPYGKEAK